MTDTFAAVMFGFGWLIAARLLTNAFYYNEREPKPYSSAAYGVLIGFMWPAVVLVLGCVLAIQFVDRHKDKLRVRGGGRVSRALIGDPYFPESVKLETEKERVAEELAYPDDAPVPRGGGHW